VLTESCERHAFVHDLRDTLGFSNLARDALGHEPLSGLPLETTMAGDPLRCPIARALDCVVFTSGQLSFDHEAQAIRVRTATGDRTTIPAPACVTRVTDDFDADRTSLSARARQAGVAHAPMSQTTPPPSRLRRSRIPPRLPARQPTTHHLHPGSAPPPVDRPATAQITSGRGDEHGR
jgi:hypothetical protein